MNPEPVRAISFGIHILGILNLYYHAVVSHAGIFVSTSYIFYQIIARDSYRLIVKF